MVTSATSAHCFDCIDNVCAIDDFTENGITPALWRWAAVVEEVVVFDVDEELGCCRMGVVGASHGNGVAVVAKAILCFVLDGFTSFLFLHANCKTTALDHEVVDDAMEDGAIIVARLDVVEEVLG